MRDTIKKHEDFIMTDENPTAKSVYFIVRAKSARFVDNPRIGFTASKRTFKFAVQRNRAKRLLRDWARYCADLMVDEFDYVFIARTSILEASREDGRYAMVKALGYISQNYAKKLKKNVKKMV